MEPIAEKTLCGIIGKVFRGSSLDYEKKINVIQALLQPGVVHELLGYTKPLFVFEGYYRTVRMSPSFLYFPAELPET